MTRVEGTVVGGDAEQSPRHRRWRVGLGAVVSALYVIAVTVDEIFRTITVIVRP